MVAWFVFGVIVGWFLTVLAISLMLDYRRARPRWR